MNPDKRIKHFSSGMMAAVPVIRGTRVAIQMLLEYLREGRGLDAFLRDHPQVTAAQANRTLVLALEALIEQRRNAMGSGER